MKILVVGYGSMGRRRIRLLNKLFKDDTIVFICVDNNKKRLEQIRQDGYGGFSSLSEAIEEKPDVAFVCTSPGHHAEIILQIIDAGIDVFTELNLLTNKYDEIVEKARDKGVKVFMSNTMLYDKQILAIMNKIKEKRENYTYIYHVGQYLPDWHPWESYKDFFIGNKSTNGCREILAIQLPWLVKLFGSVDKISVVRKKNTGLDIDFEDTYIITLIHESGNTGVFVCDVLARKAVQYLEIMGEHNHIIWNGTVETLLAFNDNSKQMEKMNSYDVVEHMDGYADIINEDQYFDEIKAFIDWRNGGPNPAYTLEDDKYILDLIDEIERQ